MVDLPLEQLKIYYKGQFASSTCSMTQMNGAGRGEADIKYMCEDVQA